MSPTCRNLQRSLLAALLGSLLAACGGGGDLEADIRQRFAERHDRDLCFKVDQPFPATLSADPVNKETLMWLSALEHAGLVSARELPPDPRAFFADRRYEFSLSEAGRKAMQPDNGFCYGRAEIVDVIDYTQPSEVNGAPTVQAEARLKRTIHADWARDPLLADVVDSSEDTVRMLLVKKAKGGWSPAY